MIFMKYKMDLKVNNLPKKDIQQPTHKIKMISLINAGYFLLNKE